MARGRNTSSAWRPAIEHGITDGADEAERDGDRNPQENHRDHHDEAHDADGCGVIAGSPLRKTLACFRSASRPAAGSVTRIPKIISTQCTVMGMDKSGDTS